MTAANSKITYTAAEVAELIRPLSQSVEALQKENAALKRKLEHMNEVLANAQGGSPVCGLHLSCLYRRSCYGRRIRTCFIPRLQLVATKEHIFDRPKHLIRF